MKYRERKRKDCHWNRLLSFIYSSTDCVLVLGNYTVFVEFT